MNYCENQHVHVCVYVCVRCGIDWHFGWQGHVLYCTLRSSNYAAFKSPIFYGSIDVVRPIWSALVFRMRCIVWTYHVCIIGFIWNGASHGNEKYWYICLESINTRFYPWRENVSKTLMIYVKDFIQLNITTWIIIYVQDTVFLIVSWLNLSSEEKKL